MLVCRSGIDLTAVFGLSLVLAAGCGGSNLGGTPPPVVSWGRASEIDAGLTTASSPRIAVDRTTGDAFAVWLQIDGARTVLFASQLDRAAGTWSPPLAIDATRGAGDSSAPQVVVDGSRRAFAIWVRPDGGTPSVPTVWVSRYAAGTWSTPVRLDAGTSTVLEPQPRIAVNAAGRAVAVWRQVEATRFSVWASRFDPGTSTWGSPELVEQAPDTPAEDVSRPDVAVAGTDDAFAIWVQPSGPSAPQSIWASRFRASGGVWEPSRLLETDTGAADSPSVVADNSGNAALLWEQTVGGARSVRSSRFANGISPVWSSIPDLLEASNQPADRSVLAMNGAGVAAVVWRQADGSVDSNSIWASRLSPFSGFWSAPVLVESFSVGPADNPHVGIDPAGDVTAIWQQVDAGGTRTNIWSSRLAATATTWASSELVEEDNAGDATAPRVAVDAAGEPVAVWEQRDGTGRQNVLANTRP